MTLCEKSAYLRGLADGMELDLSKPENKLLSEVVDLLLAFAEENDELRLELEELQGQVDEIDEDLSMVEDEIYGDCDCDCCDDDDCDCCCDDDDCDCGCCDGDLYEVTCPTCGDTVYVDESMLDDGECECPGCGELLEFDIDCDCDCGCHHEFSCEEE